MKKRLLSILLVLCMVCTLLPVSAFAADITDSGTCGENLTWTLDENGLLTISGEGDMPNYEWSYPLWHANKDKIKSIVIDDGVTSVGRYAFGSCPSLTSVEIPDSVTRIGQEAFYYCPSLTSVVIPDSVTDIDRWAFAFCRNLTSVTIGNSVTSIGDYAFNGCSSLTSVTIPDSVMYIWQDAFANCSSLTDVEIGGGVMFIDGYVFGDCGKLTNINVSENNERYASVDGVLFIKDMNVLFFYPAGKCGAYTVPDGITYIYDDAFINCYGLTSVTIPESVTSLDGSTFVGCSSLTEAKFEGNAPTEFEQPDLVTRHTIFVDCADDFKILAPEGNTTWTDSEAYNAEAGTWNGNPIEFYHVHSYTATTTAPTCTENGYTTYTCVCGDSYVADEVDALGHNYGAPIFMWNGYNCSAVIACSCGDTQPVECTVTSAVTTEATTSSEGVRTYTATVVINGQTYTSTETESIPKLDDGGSSNIITTIINAIKSAVDRIINSIISIFK